MLCQRRRRWPSIEMTLNERPLFFWAMMEAWKTKDPTQPYKAERQYLLYPQVNSQHWVNVLAGQP